MRVLTVLLILAGVCCSIPYAQAGSVSERVKARGFVRCGSVDRPGLASDSGGGRWTGLYVDVCRAVATAVLGSPDRIEYHGYGAPKDFDDVRNGQDDLYFLTSEEINEQRLAETVVAGPTVFMEYNAVMVASASAARHVSDLAGDSVCFMIGSSAEQDLEAYFEMFHRPWLRRAFSEEEEMMDAYLVQNCHAIAGEITALAQNRIDGGVNRLVSRILPEPLAAFPVMATTGKNDAEWSAIVAWTVQALISAESPEAQGYQSGDGAIHLPAQELGLNKGWQRRVIGVVGNYGDIFDRNLGKNSPLKLDRGLNACRIYAD